VGSGSVRACGPATECRHIASEWNVDANAVGDPWTVIVRTKLRTQAAHLNSDDRIERRIVRVGLASEEVKADPHLFELSLPPVQRLFHDETQQTGQALRAGDRGTCEQLRKMLANRRGRWGLNRALTPGVGSGPNCACSLPKGKSQVAR